ncbi:MAG: GC-type dockerin domain-anchored protein [Phycisphaerales bacterium]
MSTQQRTHRAIVAIALAGSAPIATAQPFQQVDYSVTHTIGFTAGVSVTAVTVSVSDFRHAWARAGVFEDSQYVSNTQLPDFDPFGTDTFASPSSFNSGLFGVPVACQYETFTLPPTGTNSFACTQAIVPGAMGTACNQWDIAPFGTTPPFVISGTIGSSGGATATTSNSRASEAYGFSTTALWVNGNRHLASGSIQWGVNLFSDTVGGGAGASAATLIGDPIHIVATNTNTGDVVDSVLLGITFQGSDTGVTTWGPTGFQSDGTDWELVIRIPPAHVAAGQSGDLKIRVESGVVTESDDSGAFDAILPPIGFSAPIPLPLPPSFPLDYDLGLDPTQPWDVDMILSGAGDANPKVDCPVDYNGDGALNVDDIDLFVGFFLDGAGPADLNADGAFNIDDIDLFIDLFLSGCDTSGGG